MYLAINAAIPIPSMVVHTIAASCGIRTPHIVEVRIPSTMGIVMLPVFSYERYIIADQITTKNHAHQTVVNGAIIEYANPNPSNTSASG